MQSGARFNEVPEKVQEGFVESRAKFDEVPEKYTCRRLQKLPDGLGAARFNVASFHCGSGNVYSVAVL